MDKLGRIWVFGGRTLTNYSDKVLRYEIDRDQWTIVTSMPMVPTAFGQVTDSAGRIYLVGGEESRRLYSLGFCPSF